MWSLVILNQSECCLRGRTRRIQSSTAFVQAHFSSPHSSRRLASLANFRRQDTRANNTLSELARRLLYKMRYILWAAALLGSCDVIQDGRHIGRHLGFYRKLGIVKKRSKLEIFDAGHAEYDIIKLLPFCLHLLHFSHKKGKNTNFSSKMAWPPAAYDVISRSHSNWFSPSLCQNASQGYAHSYWKRQV